MQITGYDSPTHDRFDSGYPTAPVNNNDSGFIGINNDWSGVTWAASNSQKSFPLLSPDHYVVARHFGGAASIRSFDQFANLQTGNQQSIENIGYGIALSEGAPGDLSIGTLTEAMQNVKRYAILDLNTSSTTNSNNYANLDLLIYGHGGNATNSTRVAAAPFLYNVGYPNSGEYFLTSRTGVQLQTFDSGSPVFADYTNPNGDSELALIGNHAAIDTVNGYNLHNFLGTYQIMAALQSFMNDDGRSLRVTGNPSYTWVGSSSTEIAKNSAWGLGGNPNNTGASSDRYVLFNPVSAASQSINVNSNYELRGLYFKSFAGTNPFTFSGSSTLTIGRGGITNYDADQQAFTANLQLGTSQYWDAGIGGLAIVNLNTNGNLLEIDSAGASAISGNISGAGSLALSDGALTLSGSSSYTGATWAHSGNLQVTGSIASSSALVLGSPAVLSGTGTVPTIEGTGTISPGNSPGILTTTAVDPSGGLDFDFEFSAASAPDFTAPSASINDLLRITAATPFENNLTANNEISVYLDVASLSAGQQFLGGFFTDENTDFIEAIKNAQVTTYLADPTGNVTFNGQTYSADTNPLGLVLSTILQTANFGSGPISGRILQLQVVDQTNYADWKLYNNLSGNDALNTADTDGDGIAQLLEFALGGNPNINDRSILPTHALVEDAGSSYLELSVTRPKDLQGVTYTPLTTADLSSWPSDSTGIADDSPIPSDNGDGTETLNYRRSQAVAGAEQGFLRVEVSETP